MTRPSSRSHRLSDIVAKLGGELVGAADTEIRRMATLESAEPGDLAFVSGAKYLDQAVVEDANFISSRYPGDLPAFIEASLQKLAGGQRGI